MSVDASGDRHDRPATHSVFDVPRMDCPAEERLVRLALEGEGRVLALEFDLAARRVSVWHRGEVQEVASKLEPLALGVRLLESRPASRLPRDVATLESRTLWWVLAINATMFVVEMTAGWWAESTGLLADSLDMLADAAVYGVSLYAVERPAALRLCAARLAGVLQLLLALGALGEVARRALGGSTPEPVAMVGVALLALVANVACLGLLSGHRDGGVHMKASWIFSANDVIANVGVIVAGALVSWTGSSVPDLVIGALVGCLVLAGGVRILRLP